MVILTKKAENFVTFFILSVLISVLALSGISVIAYNGYIIIDFLIIPLIMGCLLTNKKYSTLLAIVWGVSAMISPEYPQIYQYDFLKILPKVLTAITISKTFTYLSVQHKTMSMTSKIISSILIGQITNYFTTSFLLIGYGYNTSNANIIEIMIDVLLKKTFIEIGVCIATDLILKQHMRIKYHKEDPTDVRLRLGAPPNQNATGFQTLYTDSKYQVSFVKNSKKFDDIRIRVNKENAKNKEFTILSYCTVEGKKDITMRVVEGDLEKDHYLISKAGDNIDIERVRKNMRLENLNIEIEYKLFNNSIFEKGQIIDISKKGMQLKIKEDFLDEIDENNYLQLKFSNKIPISNIVQAEVVNYEKGDNCIGLKFVNFQKNDKANLINWIFQRCQYKQCTNCIEENNGEEVNNE